MNFRLSKPADVSDSKHWPGYLFRAFVVTGVCLVCLSGCSYPQIGEKAYEICKALYTTCNLKREKDLDTVSELIRQAASDSEISESESELLLSIVAQAEGGAWEAAEQEVRTILEDQTDL